MPYSKHAPVLIVPKSKKTAVETELRKHLGGDVNLEECQSSSGSSNSPVTHYTLSFDADDGQMAAVRLVARSIVGVKLLRGMRGKKTVTKMRQRNANFLKKHKVKKKKKKKVAKKKVGGG